MTKINKNTTKIKAIKANKAIKDKAPQNTALQNKIEIYRDLNNKTEIKVHFDNETLWMNQKQIAEAVKALRTTLDVADRGIKAPRFNFEKSHLLYQQLLSPVEGMLSGKEHLIVATSGALGQLPFAVLVKQAWAKTDHAQAPWLIRDIGISHVSSSSAWVALKALAKTPSGSKPMMAWGDPSFALNANSSVSWLLHLDIQNCAFPIIIINGFCENFSYKSRMA